MTCFVAVLSKEMPILRKKIIIRHLPRKLTEDEFRDMISPIPPHDYLKFCKADPSLGDKGFTRAYINFINEKDIFDFQERFTDYVFVDSEVGGAFLF